MDPTTTLFTFMLQTHPSVQTVHLIGSWDNFNKPYTMERDSRRNNGQWRGCHNFEDIICHGDAGNAPKRSGGLKMGQTYYYYYEVNGSSEVHDPSLPSTTACPYLPGQPVNTLWIPVEQSLRKRSGSLNSLRSTDYKTMDPAAKYAKLKPAAPIIDTAAAPRRLDTAPQRMQQQHKRSARSISPGSGWSFSPRKLFSRKTSSSSLKESTLPPTTADDERATARSEGSRSRDISPESLRRFLVDDAPLEEEQQQQTVNTLAIPEDIVEENEDDDNFATSAVSETMQYTGLSPPPLRAISPTPTITPASLAAAAPVELPGSSPLPVSRFNNLPRQPTPIIPIPSSTTGILRSRFTTAAAPAVSEPASPDSVAVPGFYHSDNDNDDIDAEDDDDDDSEEKPAAPRVLSSKLNKSTYSLPKTAMSEKVPALPLLTATIPDSGLVDDLVGELGWMADFITA
ncbi:hypothetical protein QBC40DRAFT_275887 [Triangularia verruculosa]|uniref:Uncharacterized protein n=1 Tax=Triangularia verruculosa TaxID=2587418 RepID=A0AAN7AY13_9PEZI|nr:hypothetical protein QBC40DRAFT_275887 [Triangularia verruculosa]